MTFDLEKRARELWPDGDADWPGVGAGQDMRERGKMLAREYADAEAEKWAEKCAEFQRAGDRSADARAEEIAKALKRESWRYSDSAVGITAGLQIGSDLARSFISNPAEDDHKEDTYGYWQPNRMVIKPHPDEAAIRADEREKQRLLIDHLWERVTATHARLDGLEARRKREQVLEEALRSMPCSCTQPEIEDAREHSLWCNRRVAIGALEAK